MIDGAGTIGVDMGVGGLSISDNSRAVRLFKITSGSNPYTATEVFLDDADGSRVATATFDVVVAGKQLHEVNGNAKVKAGRIVIGFPNPVGAGFFFDADGLAPTSRLPIDFCVVKNGSGYVTDIKVTWVNADGTTECETVPECVGATCDDLWWCTTTGVVSLPTGTEPDPAVYYSGPYTTYADALAACDADSGGPGEPSGGTVTCCGPRQLNSTLYASLDGGFGTVTLTWDGSTYWAGSKALSCGETLYLRFDESCQLTYSCNGTTFTATTVLGMTSDCGPPFVYDGGTAACDMDAGGIGCSAGSCGTVNVTEVSE
jgi:hypothetical protein